MENQKNAEKILSRLSVKTNCFTENVLVHAHYLVCVDDDITSAFYAAHLYHYIYKLYGYHPSILCVGGIGPLSKYLNKKGESEGQKLCRVCMELGVKSEDLLVLDKGTNTGLNCLEIYHLREPMPEVKAIICLTERLSLRFRQTFEFLDKQYPGQVNTEDLQTMIASTYYYVPKQSMEDQMQIFNGKGICGGILYYSEIASIYDRIERYSGKLQKPLDFPVPQEIRKLSKQMAKKYPLKINMYCLRGILQFLRVFLYVSTHRWKIRKETRKAIEREKSRIE